MKYLHDEGLSQQTKILTALPVGGGVSQRVVHGRLEAYTTKRNVEDKRYANKLGESWTTEFNAAEKSVWKRSQSTSVIEKGNRKRSWTINVETEKATRRRSQSAGVLREVSVPASKPGRKTRACSFDIAISDEDRGVARTITSSSALSQANVIPSALGDFAEQGTRRLMTDLILTLNMSFPDFDFGALQPPDFVSLSMENAVNRINKRFSDVARKKEAFLGNLWTAVDSVMTLHDCEVYSYQPVSSHDADPMAFLKTLAEEENAAENTVTSPDDTTTSGTESVSQPSIATIWSFNYFFVNKAAKRILLFTCVESMKSHEREDNIEDEDYAVFVPSSGDHHETDFDLDPGASLAGGIPISSVSSLLM